jgi:hypothetical protein
MRDSAPTSFVHWPDASDDDDGAWNLAWWFALLMPAFLILAFYWTATGRTALGWGCAEAPPPSTYMDVMGLRGGGGEWHGAEYESGGAAAALGALLWLATGLALWRTRRRHGAVTLALCAAFLVVFVVSLGALAAMAPHIWGPAHCVV